MERVKKFEPLWGVWNCEEVLGEGAFGRVYKAVRKEGNHVYYSAIKHVSVPASDQQLHDVRSSGYHKSEQDVSRYFDAIVQDVQKEIDFMYTLKGNANIVSYEDHMVIPKENGIGCDIFIRMELLRDISSLSNTLSPAEVIKLGTDICTALEICKNKGILHRDIKPSNIFVNDDGIYKLGDFGIAKALGGATTGMSKKGTYSYMAPEIYKCEPANHTSDIYSLGVVLYKLLNDNRLPFMPLTGAIFPQHQDDALMKMISGAPMPPPRNAPPALSDVILKACAYNKRDRFRSPAEFKKALSEISDSNDFIPESIAPAKAVSAKAVSAKPAPAKDAPAKAVPEEKATMVNPVIPEIQPEEIIPEKEKPSVVSGFLGNISRKTATIIIAVLAALAIFELAFFLVLRDKNTRYHTAVFNLEHGNYYEAAEEFDELGNYRDSELYYTTSMYCYSMLLNYSSDNLGAVYTLENLSDDIDRYSDYSAFDDYEFWLNNSNYCWAHNLLYYDNFDEAKDIFISLGDYADSADMVTECDYLKAKDYYSKEQWDDAKEIFSSLGDYSDSSDMVISCDYAKASERFSSGQWSSAKEIFSSLGDYSDSATMTKECDYQIALAYYNNGQHEDAKEIFSSLGKHSDSAAYVALCDFQYAKENYSTGDVKELRKVFKALKTYSKTNEECKEALAAKLFTKMKLCNSHYYYGKYYIEYSSDGKYADIYLPMGPDKLNYKYSILYCYEGEYGMGYYTQKEDPDDDDYTLWFEIVSFSDPYAEKPKSVTIKNPTNGKTYTFKR